MMNPQNTAKPKDFKGQKGEKREKRPPKKITEKYLYNAGLAYLQRFPASTQHFRTIMTRKIDRSCRHHTDQSREECLKNLDKTVEKFKDLALLDDAAYAKGMVTSLRNKGLPAQAIMMKLKVKGLSPEDIKHALSYIDEETDGEADYLAGLKYIRRKRLGCFKTRDKERDKELASLARAGFSYDLAQRILDTEEEDAEDFMRSAL